jgi:hypothetical protein
VERRLIFLAALSNGLGQFKNLLKRWLVAPSFFMPASRALFAQLWVAPALPIDPKDFLCYSFDTPLLWRCHKTTLS